MTFFHLVFKALVFRILSWGLWRFLVCEWTCGRDLCLLDQESYSDSWGWDRTRDIGVSSEDICYCEGRNEMMRREKKNWNSFLDRLYLLYVCPSVYLSVCLYLPISVCVCLLSVSLIVCPSVCLLCLSISIYLSISVCVCLFVCVTTHPSISPSVFLSLLVHPFISLCLCIFYIRVCRLR